MLSLICMVLMVWVFGSMLFGAVRLSWGIAKVVLSLVFLPVVLIGMILFGLIKLALPILIILAIVGVIRMAATA